LNKNTVQFKIHSIDRDRFWQANKKELRSDFISLTVQTDMVVNVK